MVLTVKGRVAAVFQDAEAWDLAGLVTLAEWVGSRQQWFLTPCPRLNQELLYIPQASAREGIRQA